MVSNDGRISERSLSILLSLDPDYVAKLRAEGESPPYCRLPVDPRSRISYFIGDVAEWLVDLRECPECRRRAVER